MGSMPNSSAISSTIVSAAEGCIGRARGAVGRGLGLVNHNVETLNFHVWNIVAGKEAHGAGVYGGAGVSARLIGQICLAGNDFAVSCCSHLQLDIGPGGGPRSLEYLLPRHYKLHWRASLARKQGSQGLQIDGYLTAKPAAYLHGNDPDLGHG